MNPAYIRQHKNIAFPTFKNMDSLVEDMERRNMSSAAIAFALMAANTALESTAKAVEYSMVYTQVNATWHKVKSTHGLFFAATKASAIRKAAEAIPKKVPTLPAPTKPNRRQGLSEIIPIIARLAWVRQRGTVH